MSPKINDGDKIVVDILKNPENANIVVVSDDNNHLICKEFHKESDAIRLISINPDKESYL